MTFPNALRLDLFAVLFCWFGSVLPAKAGDELLAEWDFARSHSALGWSAKHDLLPAVASEDGLLLHIGGADPFVIGPRLKLPTEEPLCVRVRLWSEFGGVGQVYVYDEAPSEVNSVHFEVPADHVTEILVALPPAPAASSRLRFDPPGTGGDCLVEWLRVEAPAAAGVLHVLATEDELVLQGKATDEDLEMVELAPQDSIAAVRKAPVVGRMDVRRTGRVTVPRFDGERDRLYSGFAARTIAAGRMTGAVHFVEEMKGVSKCSDPLPEAAGKKGLQVQMVDDALALGVKQATLNVNLAGLIDPKGDPDSLTWRMDGQTYHFHRAAVEALPVKPLSDAGVQVTLILLTYVNGDATVDYLTRHPRAALDGPSGVVAFNTHSADGVRWLKACTEFLADRFSGTETSHGRVAAYIVGNEVNSYNYWYNLGRVPMETVAEEYLKAVRLVHTAVRKSSAHARVYISLDHYWNRSFDQNPLQSSGGRPFLDHFNRLCRLGGDIDWHLAHHPYPENMFDPRSWRDKQAEQSQDAPWITYKNLEQLPAYLRRPEMLYRGEARRIILSEQGFHSPETPEGQTWQAAGFCYAYRKTVQLDGIDAFILHRHVDYWLENGLNCGLWTRRPDSLDAPFEKKRLYEVFRRADTADWEKAFEFALPEIGISKWDELTPAVLKK